MLERDPVLEPKLTWQLIIDTGTTIVTFLMVTLIQNTQNRDGAAVQAKLDELIRAGSGENVFVGIGYLPAEEVEAFRKRCEEAVAAAEQKEQRKVAKRSRGRQREPGDLTQPERRSALRRNPMISMARATTKISR
jgi:low affinity Fe/Cu permease